jgi:hypothetical protein
MTSPADLDPAMPCQWYSGCDNTATTTRPGPIILAGGVPGSGPIPICDRCNERVARMDAR